MARTTHVTRIPADARRQPMRDKKPDARQEIIEAAIVLMKQSGLSGAGINQIRTRSGAPKGSMYHYFPDGKMQIASEALTLFAQRVAAGFEKVLSAKQTPGEKIRGLFRFIAALLDASEYRQSCAAGAVTLDLDADTAALAPVIAAAFAAWRSVIAAHLPVGSRARRESLAGLVLSAIEGAYIRGRAERSSKAFLEAGQWLALLIEREITAANSAHRTKRRVPTSPKGEK